MADGEDQEARRRRLVAQAKAEAAMLNLERTRPSATEADRSAAYAGFGKKPKPATVDEAAEQIRAQEAAAAAPSDPTVSDAMRERGAREIQAGLDLYGMADKTRKVKVRNKDYEAVRDYTGAMGAGQGVGRRGIFSPGAAVLAPPAPAQPPVQVVVQAPGAPPPAPPSATPPTPAPAPVPPVAAQGTPVPAGAVGLAPGQLPAAPLSDVPLEGQPPPGETPEQELARLEAEAAAMSPEQLEAQAATDYMTPEQDPAAMGVPAEALADGTPGGILQRRLDAQEMIARDTVGAATEEALALRDAADQARASLEEARAAQAEQDARLEQQLEASQAANRTVADLTKKAQEMPAIDPRRAWSNMGIGKKIGFALQIALSSFGGRGTDTALAPIRRYIEEDIEAQREGLAKVGQDIDAARAVASDRANLLEQSRAVVGDERVAEDMVRIARLEQVKADLVARAAAAGVPLKGSEQEAILNDLEGDIAKLKLGVEAQASRNPQYFTKKVHVFGKGAREGMKLAGKKFIEQGVGASELADKQSAKLEEDAAKGQIDALLQQQKQAAKKGDKVAADAYAFGKDTAVAQSVVGQIDKILSQDDIAGYGYTEGIDTPGKMTTDTQIRLLLDDLGRLKSGGAITEDELQSFRSMVLGGVEFGDGSIFETSEGRMRTNLETLKSSIQMRVEAHQRGLSEQASSYYDRVVAPADFAPRWSGGSSASVVEED